MKVLHIITGLGVGGAELQLRSILQHTQHEAEVLCLYNPGDVAEMIRADGTPVQNLGMTSNTQVPALWRLWKLIRDGGYDVVHTHLYRACIYGKTAAWLAGTPVVVATEHSIGETHLERRRMTQGVRALYLATDKFCDETIAVSDAVATRLINWGMPARKISVIPNGVDFQRVAFDPVQRAKVRAEHGIDDSTFVIGVLGRLDANKRFDLVIEAAAPLLGEKAKLLVVGGGAELENLRAAAGRNQVSQHVVFAGERHDVAAVLSAFDLFVAASAQETFGLSVLEALANGLPVLYTTCPALDGVPTERATRVPGEVGGMRAAMAAEIEFPRVRAEEVEVRRRYGIESVTERIDELYLRLHQRRSGLVPVGRP